MEPDNVGVRTRHCDSRVTNFQTPLYHTADDLCNPIGAQESRKGKEVAEIIYLTGVLHGASPWGWHWIALWLRWRAEQAGIGIHREWWGYRTKPMSAQVLTAITLPLLLVACYWQIITGSAPEDLNGAAGLALIVLTLYVVWYRLKRWLKAPSRPSTCA